MQYVNLFHVLLLYYSTSIFFLKDIQRQLLFSYVNLFSYFI